MTRVLLYGASGMLGTAIREQAADDMTIDYPASHHKVGVEDLTIDQGWLLSTLRHQHPDVVINTIGTLPDGDWADSEMAYVNAVFPHLLMHAANSTFTGPPIPVIHVSTDCVLTLDSHYARTKLAGESEYAINVRTSFVGPRHGLWAWAAQHVGAGEPAIEGWARALWSGSTVNAVAQALLMVARDPGKPRTLNLATESAVSKYLLLCDLRLGAGLDILPIKPVEEPVIDRTMVPDIVLPPFAEALREMVG